VKLGIVAARGGPVGCREVECDSFEIAEQRDEAGELMARGELAQDSPGHCYVWHLYAARAGKVLAAYRHTYNGATRVDGFLVGPPAWLPVEHFTRACVQDRNLTW
jgi:hypothetical protein